MSRSLRCASRRHGRRGLEMHRRRHVPAIAALLVMLLALAACSSPTGGDAPVPEGAEGAAPAVPSDLPATGVPAIPEATSAPDATPTAPATRPRPGPVVLLHLEGPVTDPSATDLVVRDEAGTEIDRFRLVGAVDVHVPVAAGAWALVETRDGPWARYDAAAGTLSLVTFEGPAPAGTPSVHGPLAVWDDPAAPWLLRLDTGVSHQIGAQVGPGGQVTAVTPDGGHVLVRGDRDHVVDTVDGAVRTLPPQDEVTFSGDGLVLASTAPGDGGTDVYTEGIDGQGRGLVATVPAPGVPIPLADGRTAVVGSQSRLIELDGTLVDLPPVPGASGPVFGAAGVRAVVATPTGLVVLDPGAGTVVAVPASQQLSVTDGGVDGRLWATGEGSGAPGVTVLDLAAGTVSLLLPDGAALGVASMSRDGRRVVVGLTGAGSPTVLVDADGQVETLGAAAVAVDAVIHPTASILAVAVVQGATRSLVVGPPGAAVVEIPTGRSPAWLTTAD